MYNILPIKHYTIQFITICVLNKMPKLISLILKKKKRQNNAFLLKKNDE